MTVSSLISKSRLEALSDGVYAVALTLLALDLKLPPLADPSSAALNAALADLLPKGLVWLLSFWVASLYWLAQHRVLRQYARLDDRGLLFELLQLALITLLPFSTALIGEHGDLVAAALVYSIHLSLLATLSLLRVLRLSRRPDLRSREFEPGILAVQLQRAWVVLGSTLACVVLAFFVPSWNMLAMLGIVFRRRMRDSGVPETDASGERGE